MKDSRSTDSPIQPYSTVRLLMMTEPGAAYFGGHQAAGLRNYLLRGGFLWADDFWGTYAWTFWQTKLRKALPAASCAIVDIPLAHPIFHCCCRSRRVRRFPASATGC